MKLHYSYMGTACSVLGMHERLDSGIIKKKFRQISMCTHPDRLRGRLKRQPTDAEVRRGEVLFNRASKAKDELQDTLAKATKKKTKKTKKSGKWVVEVLNPDRPDPVVYCHERSSAQVALRKTVRDGSREIKEYFEVYGVSTTLNGIVDYFWGLFSFQHGFMGTIMSILWLSFVFKMMKNFVGWIWGIGISAPFYLVQVAVFAPVPTIWRFFVLPVMRVAVYLKEVRSTAKPKTSESSQTKDAHPYSDDEPSSPPVSADGTEATETSPMIQSSATASAAADEKSTLRRRKRIKPGEEANRRLTQQQKLEKQMRKIHREILEPDSEADETDEAPTSSWDLVARCLKGKEQICRAVGAKNIQVEMMVILTKPILPLVMVVMFGQVWSGLFMSVVMWEAYRRIPTFFYEYHHLLCMMFGFIHTWIGVTASEVERQAENEHGVQRLLWEWSYRDCIMVLFLCLTGAENSVYSSLGNEPAYTSSFASGIALRILFESDFVRDFSLTKMLRDSVTNKLHFYGIQVDTADEQLVYGGGGVGDCGGGTFEMFVGEDWSGVVSFIVQIALCMLPLLYAVMWIQRGVKGYTSVKRSSNLYTRRLPRICARMTLGVGGLMQVALCLAVSLNTSHGGLYNFWLSMLVGVWMESMISTYDIRGPVRSLVFLIIFCFA